MKYSLVFYILFAIAVGLGGTMSLARMSRVLAAIVFLILSVLIFVFFGLRWFTYGAPDTSVWPPVINSCPDYLTLYTRGSGTSAVQSCVDMLGVSKDSGLLNKFPELRPGDPIPTDRKYYFPQNVDSNAKLSDAPDKLCAYTIASGLSWEGLVNGISCIGRASGSSSASGGGSGGGCPAR
jgi:hypothetical protein